MQTTMSIHFKDYIFKTPENKMIIKLSIAATICQFIVFKYFYPQAGFIYADSYSYLNAAFYNYDINTYMVGYSKFLRLFSVFTSSDVALVAFQYLLIQTSSIFFLFTIFYFYNPYKPVKIILIFFMVLNPLFLYLANYVSSDPLFLALSLIWFALLLWIIYKPSMKIVIIQAIFLSVAFMTRYNALIYPVILLLVVLISPLRFRRKIFSICLSFSLCAIFVLYTSIKYKNVTGQFQYSPFSGWQIVNNAMYAYRYVDSADRKPVPSKYSKLDQMIREYFDSSRNLLTHPIERDLASTAYMWNRQLTLYKYRDMLFENEPLAGEFKRWASMGPFYKEYGIYLIKQYPLHYLRYFIWPNANKYYATPVEFLENYNSGKDSVSEIAKTWFGFKSWKVHTRTKSFAVHALDFYPTLTGIANVVMFCSLICFILMKGLTKGVPFREGIFLGGCVWFANALFTIVASSAALRFQSFPIILVVTYDFILIDWLIKMGKAESLENETLIGTHQLIDKSATPQIPV